MLLRRTVLMRVKQNGKNLERNQNPDTIKKTQEKPPLIFKRPGSNMNKTTDKSKFGRDSEKKKFIKRFKEEKHGCQSPEETRQIREDEEKELLLQLLMTQSTRSQQGVTLKIFTGREGFISFQNAFAANEPKQP